MAYAELAAIVMMAVTGLISFKAIKQVWSESKPNGVVAVATFAATLAFAPRLNIGTLLRAGLAIGLYLCRTLNLQHAFVERHYAGGRRNSTEDDALPPRASQPAGGQSRNDPGRSDDRTE